MPSEDAIYVEIPIDAPIEPVWDRTQDPDKHQRWDLRFTDIEYLPSEDGEPQRFTYRTHVGGVGVAGTGESVASADPDDREPTSALRFWSADPKSLIENGRGYWRYVPTADGLRFITEYNYDARFGLPGRIVDRLLFRPLIGWATAFGFDALRTWVEDDVSPEATLTSAVVHALARLALVFVWFWQGLVPKLILRHPVELAHARIVFGSLAEPVVVAVGLFEVALGLSLLVFWRRRWPLVLSGLVVAVFTTGAVVSDPASATGPFNAVTIAVAALALVGAALHSLQYVPTATNCLRERSADEGQSTATTATAEDVPPARTTEA